MTTATTTLGVVVQMTHDTPIRAAAALWPGDTSGSLELVGDLGDLAGVSLTFTSTLALQRLLDAGQVLLGQMMREQRQVEEQEAWAQRTAAAGGRPPLRALRADEVAAASRPFGEGLADLIAALRPTPSGAS